MARIARLSTNTGPRYAVLDGERWAAIDDPFADEPRRTGEQWPVEGAVLLAPVQPTVVLGAAHNGSAADRELPPQFFWKSARSVVGPGDPIRLDPEIGAVNIEGELAVVIRRTSRRLTAAEVPGAILGYTIANDVTAVDQIGLDSMMLQSKSGDGFTPIGPWIETELDPDRVRIRVSIDGEPVAAASTAELGYNVVEQLVHLTSVLTLGPGDIVITGSPKTFARVLPGQRTVISLDGIGALENPAVSELELVGGAPGAAGAAGAVA